MSEITPETFPTTMKGNVLAGLPDYLKDPEAYKKIRKAQYELIASTCDHAEVIEYASCFKCQQKLKDHADFIRKLGFTSPAQYYAWRKIHETIEQRVSLPKYNS